MELLICGVFFSFLANLDLAHSLDKLNKSPLVSNLICGLIHNLIIVIGVGHYFSTGSIVSFEILRMISMGYLIADCLYFYISQKVKHSNIYLFHHLIFLSGWFYGSNLSLPEKNIFYTVLLAEISSITLNIRNLAKFYNFPRVDLVFSLLTYIFFWHFRVYNFTLIFPTVIRMRQFVFLALLTPLTLLQYYWFYLMTLKFKNYIVNNQKEKNHSS